MEGMSNEPEARPTFKKSVAREYLESIVVAVILALFIRTFAIQAFKIPTGSMESNLLIGDHLLVNKLVAARLAEHVARDRARTAEAGRSAAATPGDVLPDPVDAPDPTPDPTSSAHAARGAGRRRPRRGRIRARAHPARP